MKKRICLILAVVMLVSLAACGAKVPEKQEETKSAEEKPAVSYTISEDAAPESVVGGVMTDISGADPILKKTTASWLDTGVLYEVNVRQFTEEGTFKAFETHLDRLKDMGVNILWLMPIHPISEKERKGTLGSYYAVSDYRAVNPEFGTMEDFTHLLNKAHDMGFKVILDWVANHTGWDNSWIKDHDNWYKHNKSGEIDSPYDWTDVAQLDYDNYEMRAEMIDCMRYWIEDVGVDGFRCDHALGVPAPFWNAAVYKLKSINSEIMMLAEASANNNLTNYAFDCCYNDALYGQARMVRGGIEPSSIQKGMELTELYAEGSFPMNYVDNHDKNSYEDSVVGRFGDTYQEMLSIMFLSPGMPLIYTTDEMIYDYEIEFFEKDTVKWAAEPEYAGLITALSKLKAKDKALASTNRDLKMYESDNSGVFAFSRNADDNTVVFIGSLMSKEIKGASVKADFDSATCVLHCDGKTIDTTEKEMTAKDFEKRDYQPYEFYVLEVKN